MCVYALYVCICIVYVDVCVYALYVWIVCLYVWTCVLVLCVDVYACIVCVNVDTHLDNLGCQSLLTVPNLSTDEEEAAVTVQYKAQHLNQSNLPKVLKSPHTHTHCLQFLPPSLHHKPNSSEPCPKFNNQKRQDSEERTNSLLLW